jgi:hypothetical protein
VSGTYIGLGLAFIIGFLVAFAIGFFIIGFFIIGLALAFIIGAGDWAMAGAAARMKALVQRAMRIRFMSSPRKDIMQKWRGAVGAGPHLHHIRVN